MVVTSDQTDAGEKYCDDRLIALLRQRENEEDVVQRDEEYEGSDEQGNEPFEQFYEAASEDVRSRQDRDPNKQDLGREADLSVCLWKHEVENVDADDAQQDGEDDLERAIRCHLPEERVEAADDDEHGAGQD